MVKQFATALLFALGASCAVAQDAESQQMTMFANCMTSEKYKDYVVNQFGETPKYYGLGYIAFPFEGKTEFAKGYMLFTTNPESGTYSISITFDDGTTCEVLSGIQLTPFVIPGTPV